MRSHYYYFLFLFFLFTKTLFSALSPLRLEQSGGVGIYGYGNETMKRRTSLDSVRRDVLKQNKSLLDDVEKKDFYTCMNDIKNNRMTSVFSKYNILAIKDDNKSNLLHYAAEYQRPCLATLLLALELFYIKEGKSGEDYIPLAGQKNIFGDKPKDIAEKSLRSRKYKYRLQLNYDSYNSIQEIEEMFLAMIKEINKSYYDLFIMGQVIEEDVEDIIRVLK